MHWNYRICKETHYKGETYEEESYTIREAYYDDNGEVMFVTEDGTRLFGDSVSDLLKGYENMQFAFDKPVIDLDTHVFAKDTNELDDFDLDDNGEWPV